jgi:hypothetical protein
MFNFYLGKCSEIPEELVLKMPFAYLVSELIHVVV